MWFRASWRSLRLFAHLVTGVVLTLLLVRRAPDGAYRHRPGIVRWWHERACRILGIHVQISGALPEGSALLVANHISWLDIPVLGSAGPIAFLSKAEVRDWPVMGWLAAAAGTHFIARGSGEAAQVGERMGNHLQQHGYLALFPEGTTTDGRAVKPFFPRLLGAASTAGVPVVPVALRYRRDGGLDPIAPFIGQQTLLSHLRHTLCAPRFDVQIAIGPPLDPTRLDRRSLARRARDEIVAALAGLDQAESIP